MAATRLYGTVNFSWHTPGAKIELSPMHHVIDPAHTMLGQYNVAEKYIRTLNNNIWSTSNCTL